VGVRPRHRQRLAHGLRQRGAVAQQEVQQVEHQREAHQEIEGVLPDAERLRGDQLAGLGGTLGDPGQHRLQVAQAEAAHQVEQPLRHGTEDLLEVAPEVDLARADALRHQRGLLHQRDRHHRERDDHDHEADRQRGQRRQVAAPRHALEQPLVERREQDGQRHGPEHRAEEGQQDPEEGRRHGREQEEEDRALQIG
jgi:hypothetical protein